MEKKNYNILVFTIKPVEAADTRYRIVQYFPFLEKKGCKITFFPMLNKKFFQWNMENSHTFSRLFLFLWFYLKRIFQIIFFSPKADAVWISRELSQLGPPILEKLLFLFKKRVVLDIDDAIFIPDENVKTLFHKLRDFRKFEKIGHKYSVIVAGSRFIADYFQKFNKNVVIIPTVVNTNIYSQIEKKTDNEIRIGWIGTPFYYYDFEIMKNAFYKLAEKYNFKIIIVGLNKKLNWKLKEIYYLKWKLKFELKYFSYFDIGIMPLRETEFEKGKCGFKLIQYMAARIPVVASPVGANNDIIVDGENGFLAGNEDEWYEKLEKLIIDKNLRQNFIDAGFKTVKEKYSLERYESDYLKILIDKV